MKKKTFVALLTDTNPVHVEVGSELSTDVTDYITITDKDGNAAEVADVAEDITLDVSKQSGYRCTWYLLFGNHIQRKPVGSTRCGGRYHRTG